MYVYVCMCVCMCACVLKIQFRLPHGLLRIEFGSEVGEYGSRSSRDPGSAGIKKAIPCSAVTSATFRQDRVAVKLGGLVSSLLRVIS